MSSRSLEIHMQLILETIQIIQSFLKNPFFLAQLEPDHCMEVFQEYQFTTVPHLVYVPSGSKKVTKFREDQYMRNPQASVHDLINFVKAKIEVDVPVYHTFAERFTPVGIVILAAFILTRLVRKYNKYFYSPMLWFILAVITYMIVMAGVVFNRIRNPPFMDVQQNGKIQLISPQPRTQYVAEGMIIAVVLGGLGLLFVVLGEVVPKLPRTWRRTAFWFSAVLLFMFLATLNNIYRMKYGSPAFRLNWRFF